MLPVRSPSQCSLSNVLLCYRRMSQCKMCDSISQAEARAEYAIRVYQIWEVSKRARKRDRNLQSYIWFHSETLDYDIA